MPSSAINFYEYDITLQVLSVYSFREGRIPRSQDASNHFMPRLYDPPTLNRHEIHTISLWFVSNQKKVHICIFTINYYYIKHQVHSCFHSLLLSYLCGYYQVLLLIRYVLNTTWNVIRKCFVINIKFETSLGGWVAYGA